MVTKTGTMKAVCMHEFGDFEKLSYEDFPMPVLKPGQVLVRVHAASVNPVDYKRGTGSFRKIYQDKLPWIPGGDFSGIIEECAEDVHDLKPGVAVFGNSPPGGAYAQFVVTGANLVAQKPPNLTHIEAASLPIAAQTAWQALFKKGNLQKGQTVLIHGGSGGVGTFAVQMAAHFGATTLATGSESNLPFLKSLGAFQTIDYKKTPFETAVNDVDLVLDLVGGDTLTRSFKVLKKGGILVSIVDAPSEELALQHQVKSMWMKMDPNPEDLAGIAELCESKKIKVIIAKTYPLEQAKEAWKEIMKKHTRGKIVLIAR